MNLNIVYMRYMYWYMLLLIGHQTLTEYVWEIFSPLNTKKFFTHCVHTSVSVFNQFSNILE